ncbi:LTA synthase family protein [Clostridium folliculivorans]|uniref:LTA synthase family protein n=1 Tax=Clostridium folliculivorans TaxID=2886038 RepID=UPI00248A82F6|nr:phosphoglycerol transferase [Clostridium folliculivorans]
MDEKSFLMKTKKLKKEMIIPVIFGVILMLKSMVFLAMLRTPNSSSLDFHKMYFTPPPMWAHIACVVLVISISFLFRSKGRIRYLIILDLLVSILLLADIWYYRANGTFLSIRHILYPELFNPVKKNLFLPAVVDILYFIDFVFIAALVIKFKNKIKSEERYIFAFAATFAFSIVTLVSSYYYIDVIDGTKGEKMLFKIAWAPFQTMSDMSPLGYHGYDIYKTIYEKNAVKLSSDDTEKITQWFEDNKENLPDNEYKGKFNGKNLIFVQVESLENFVIGQKVYGQEITPNLNRLINNSLYFNNIHEQNNNGTSSDADLMVNTSILPIRQGATFFNNPYTPFTTLPNLVKEKGYNTVSTHPEVAGNWNWTEVHRGSLGFDNIWDISKFNVDEVIGLGLSDRSYLSQVADKLKDMPKPFYSFMVTLTSHGPFDMPDQYKMLNLPQQFDKTILGSYFQSVRYTDEQIGNFINKLDQEGILKDSIVVIYGDHTGVHKFYPAQLKQVKLEGDWWQKDDKGIPFIVYSKDSKGEKISKAGGQIDFLPTISYLIGIDRNKFDGSTMGRVLVNTNRDATILNYGQIIGTPKDEKEKQHLEDSLQISDMFIRGKYLNNK